MSSVSGTPHGFQLGQYAARWRWSRWRQAPWTSLGLIAAMLLVGTWVAWQRGILWAGAALALQLLVTWSWWLPVECEAGPRGLLLRQGWRRRRFPWKRLQVVHWDSGQAVLSYQDRRGEEQRQLTLVWPPGHDEISQVLSRYLRQEGAVSPSTETMIQVVPPGEEPGTEQTAQAEQLSVPQAEPDRNIEAESEKPAG